MRDDALDGEMDATIVETAFHDGVEDAKLLRSPVVRDAMARATVRGVVRHFASYGGGPLAFAPNPPAQVRATLTRDGIRVAWNAATSGFTPARYVIYRSADGRGFGRPQPVPNAMDYAFDDAKRAGPSSSGWRPHGPAGIPVRDRGAGDPAHPANRGSTSGNRSWPRSRS